MTFNIRIIRSSSREKNDLLAARVKELEQTGARVVYDEIPVDASWPYSAGSIQDRAKALQQALTESSSDIVWIARGGYGASDLLGIIDWQKLKSCRPKVVVGFSDVSALHSALFTQLGWHGLHAPMPATTLWRQDAAAPDVDQTIAMLRDQKYRGHISCQGVTGAKAPITGRLFGGCMSVLTNLIGTPYFPKSLDGAIVFLEDTGENPGRLARFWNQWLQSGAAKGVKALVLGAFRELDAENKWQNTGVAKAFAERAPGLPIFCSNAFGHISPNFPLMIGAQAKIANGQLEWNATSTVA